MWVLEGELRGIVECEGKEGMMVLEGEGDGVRGGGLEVVGE